jgi:ATP-binding cassette subfamily A (ABC1) protein 3
MKNLNKSEISNGQQSSDSSQKEVESQFKDAALWIGSEPEDRVNFIQLMLIQFYALTIKRFIHSIRNKILIVSQLLIPICVILINLLYLKYGPIQVEDSPMLEISLQSYEKNYVPINIVGVPKLDGSSVAEKIAKVYENQLTRVRGDVYIDKLHENKSRINCGADGWTNVNNYLSCVGTYSLKYLIDEYYIGLTLNYTESRPQITAQFNNQPFHIPPLTLNILTNALLKYYSKNESYSITVRNYPLPRDINEKLSDIGSRDLTSFNLATGLTFGFSFLLASFVIFIIKERSSNSKHLQYMSGANSIIFWLSALVWDVINYLIPVAVVLVLLAVSLCFFIFYNFNSVKTN